MSISPDMVRNIVEGALLAAGEPVSFERLLGLFEPDEAVGRAELRAALEELASSTKDRGILLKEVASGWRIQVREDLAPWVSRLWESRPPRYSRALLETLAVIAYQQPVTRSDIEHVRGVSVSSNIVKTLLERDWIRIVGHRDVPGRPALYGTTRAFLDYFNLRALDELPPLAELRDLDELNRELGFEADEAAAAASAGDGEPVGDAEAAPDGAADGVGQETSDDAGDVTAADDSAETSGEHSAEHEASADGASWPDADPVPDEVRGEVSDEISDEDSEEVFDEVHDEVPDEVSDEVSGEDSDIADAEERSDHDR